MKKDSRLSVLVFLFLVVAPETLCDAQDNGGKTTWCQPKLDTPDLDLIKALDWLCGAGGANCAAIRPGGACYHPYHSYLYVVAAYAFNNYYVINGKTPDKCAFNPHCEITTEDPSFVDCDMPPQWIYDNASRNETIVKA